VEQGKEEEKKDKILLFRTVGKRRKRGKKKKSHKKKGSSIIVRIQMVKRDGREKNPNSPGFLPGGKREKCLPSLPLSL